jgi:diacylglycerol kinase family enzyme
VAASDAELCRIVVDLMRDGAVPTVGLTGGDLHRTLGGPSGSPRWEQGEAMRFPIDLLEIDLDGHRHHAVAHLVAQGPAGWAGHSLVALNAAFVGRHYLGPRAHPNDGKVDVTEGRLPLSDLLEARRRFRTGSHLPHPRLRETRSSAVQVDLPRSTPVRIDARPAGRARRIAIDVHPDAFFVVI